MAAPSAPAGSSALERLLLWVPFSSVLWGIPLYLTFFHPPAWPHLVLLMGVSVVFGLALFGPPRLSTPLRALAPHLYGAVLLSIWTLGFYVLPTHPASPTGLLCTTLLAPVVYVLLFVQRPPDRARRDGSLLLLGLVLLSLPHALRTLGLAGPFDGLVLPLTLLGTHGALLGMLHHFALAQQDLAHHQAEASHLRALTHVDALTGLGNRRAFNQNLDRLTSSVSSGGGQCQVAVLDLDGLKRINDTYGHAYGDALLVTFGEALRETFRDQGLAYRFGGDEFALLVEPPLPGGPADLHSRVQVAVTRTRERGFPEMRASVGVAEVPADGDAVTAFRVADARMYAQKQARRTLNR